MKNKIKKNSHYIYKQNIYQIIEIYISQPCIYAIVSDAVYQKLTCWWMEWKQNSQYFNARNMLLQFSLNFSHPSIAGRCYAIY